MKMRWHIPGRSGKPSGKTSSAKHARQLRSFPIPASTDFNTGFSDPEDHSEGFDFDDADRPDITPESDANGEGEKRVLIGGISPGWSLKLPLLIRIERDSDGSFIVSDDIFAVHGDGLTLRHAVRDYAASLVEYYHLLSARVASDAHTMALFRRLQRYLGPVEE
jgi:hypothetical protein